MLKDGWTALHFAAREGFEQIVKFLVEHGSNVDLQTKVFIFLFLIFIFLCFFSFLYLLLWVHYLCVVVLFLNNFLLLKYGRTALHLAAPKGFEQIVKILVEHGSNVDLQDQVFIFFFWFWFSFFCFFSHFFICGCVVSCLLLIVNGCVLSVMFILFLFFF